LSRIAVTLVVLGLIAGTSAAFTVAEKLKLERSPITAPRFDRRFSPVCRCDTDRARLRVRFRRAETVDALVVDRHGDVVRTLTENEEVRRGDHTFVWNGRDDAAQVVPDGRYRLRLHLERERRTILVPTTIAVDTRPPRVTLVRVAPPGFSPDGDGRADHVKVVYLTSEKGAPELLVNGEPAVLGRPRGKGRAALNWAGRVGGEPVRAGSYELAVRVRDLAGNLSRPAGALTVAVRFVELDRDSYAVAAGGRLEFTVATDAASFGWYLFRPRGGRPGRPVLFEEHAAGGAVSVALPAGLEPGTYLLRVSANRHRDRAAVTVSRAG
jgi:hypothetical protein